jgi:hypothetical protein
MKTPLSRGRSFLFAQGSKSKKASAMLINCNRITSFWAGLT